MDTSSAERSEYANNLLSIRQINRSVLWPIRFVVALYVLCLIAVPTYVLLTNLKNFSQVFPAILGSFLLWLVILVSTSRESASTGRVEYIPHDDPAASLILSLLPEPNGPHGPSVYLSLNGEPTWFSQRPDSFSEPYHLKLILTESSLTKLSREEFRALATYLCSMYCTSATKDLLHASNVISILETAKTICRSAAFLKPMETRAEQKKQRLIAVACQNERIAIRLSRRAAAEETSVYSTVLMLVKIKWLHVQDTPELETTEELAKRFQDAITNPPPAENATDSLMDIFRDLDYPIDPTSLEQLTDLLRDATRPVIGMRSLTSET